MLAVTIRENQKEQREDHIQTSDETPRVGDQLICAGLADEYLSMKRDALMRILFPDENSTR